MLRVVGTHHKDSLLVDRITDVLSPDDHVFVEGLPPQEVEQADRSVKTALLDRIDDPERRERLADEWEQADTRTTLVEPEAVREAAQPDRITYLDGGRIDGYVTHCLGQLERTEQLQHSLYEALDGDGFGPDAAYATVVDGLNAHTDAFYGLIDQDTAHVPATFIRDHAARLPDSHALQQADTDAVADAVDRYFPDWAALQDEMVDRELRIGHEQARERYWTGKVHDAMARDPERIRIAIVGGVHAFDSPDSFYGKLDAVYDTTRRSLAKG